VTVSGNGAYPSISHVFSTAGTYYWYATYSGDANNVGLTSACEPLVVNALASPTIATTPTPTSETVGGPALKDIAHLTGGFNPTGTITFTLHDPASAIVDTETVPVSGNGDYTTPVGYVPIAVGTYQWDASYSGDSNNNAASDINARNEQVTISLASPALTTTLSSTAVTAGGSASDTATLTGGFNPTGTITFFFSTTDTCPVAGATQVGTAVTVSGNGAYSSISQVFSTAGTYYWYATYSGDPNNLGLTSACEQLTVSSAKTTPTLTTLLSSTPITAGGSASDTATLAGGNSPTGTITFFFSTSNTCPNGTGQQVGAADTVSGNGPYSSTSQTFSITGTYYWYATYSGDANNNPVTSACEPLVVQPSSVGVPEFPTPMVITTAIAFLALTVIMRKRRGSGVVGLVSQALPTAIF